METVESVLVTMFTAKNFPPVVTEDSTIIVSSLSPIPSATRPLNFQTMYQQEYRSLKKELKRTISPQKKLGPQSPIKRELKKKKAITDEYSGVHDEPTLYSPLKSKEFSLPRGRLHISPSELVLLRGKHAARIDQVELHASPMTFTPKRTTLHD